MTMTMAELAAFLDRDGLLKFSVGAGSTLVHSITHDSREITHNTLFCCVPGGKNDGHHFADQAVSSGASALLVERELPLDLPQLVVTRVRDAMGPAASALYDKPSTKLLMTAVTGTNGKSSTTYLLRSILESSDIPCGLLGTIVYHDGFEEHWADRTTPEAPDVQRWLGRMVANGCKACVLEASSHGLDQGRLRGCHFDGAIFTNLTSEHLDYHGTMERYFEAKERLFSTYMKESWQGAINLEDPYGTRLAARYGHHCLGFSLHPVSEPACFPENISMDIHKTCFLLRFPGTNPLPVTLPLTGHFLLSNALGAAALAFSLRIAPEAIVAGLQHVPQIPGRMERFTTEQGTTCVIDYAHSPDAMEKVLRALRPICKGKLWVVFGSGGERYAGNRPLIGEVMAREADHIVLTMDNPRGEDPAAIAAQNQEGVRRAGGAERCAIVLERQEAIWYAMDRAQRDDVVLIAGKGPERFILRGNQKIPHTDKGAVFAWAESHSMGWQA